MRAYRLLSLSALLAGLSALTACGGGGGASPGGVGTAALTGRVILRDGTSSNLGGILLSMPRTGTTVVTAPDGSFSFGSIPTGTIAVRLLSTAATVSTQGGGADDGPNHDVGDDNGGNGDGVDDNGGDDVNDDNGVDAIDDDSNDDGDDHDTGDDDFDVVGITDGEKIEVHMSVDGGVIESLDCSRSGSDDREAEVRMTRSVDSDDADVTGKIETEARLDRQRLKIEVEHLTVGRVVKAIVTLAGVDADLGSRTADAFGEVEWDLNTNDGDVLPHGVTTVASSPAPTCASRTRATGRSWSSGPCRRPRWRPTATATARRRLRRRRRPRRGPGAAHAGRRRGRRGLRRGERPPRPGRPPALQGRDRPPDGRPRRRRVARGPGEPRTLAKIGSMTVGSEGEGEPSASTRTRALGCPTASRASRASWVSRSSCGPRLTWFSSPVWCPLVTD